ncbi:MAG TPA: hypothetical protein VLA91_03670 [Acidimicrobiia bacterium]|nr:hypothetical protein [Acidimicrobiia bacterium]
MLASVDGGPLVLYLVILLVVVIGAGGLSIWLAVARGRAYLVPVVLMLVFLVVVWGVEATAAFTLLAAIGLSLVPAKPNSRWERHRALVASGDRDQRFFSPPMVILGVAAFPLVITVVVVLIN